MIDLSQRLADTDAGTLKELLHQLRSIPAVADDAKLSDVFGFVEPPIQQIVDDVNVAEETRVASLEPSALEALKTSKAKSPKV